MAKPTKEQKEKMKMFLEAYKNSNLVTSYACKRANISRQTFYNWIDKFDSFKKEVENTKNEVYDLLEAKMKQRALEGSDTMLIWLSKTLLKDRGYTEKLEVENTGEQKPQVVIMLPDNKRRDD